MEKIRLTWFLLISNDKVTNEDVELMGNNLVIQCFPLMHHYHLN
jgi:hypothetical protein